MTRYSDPPREVIFVKGYGCLPFAKNMGKNIGKNMSKNLSGKYSQKRLNHDTQSAADSLTIISKRVIQETAEATGDLIGNKTVERITKVSKPLPQNRLDIKNQNVKNQNHKEIHKERYMSPEEKQKIIDDSRLI